MLSGAVELIPDGALADDGRIHRCERARGGTSKRKTGGKDYEQGKGAPDEGDMPGSYTTLTLDDAKRMLAAAEVKAESFGIAYNVAVVDAGGHLLAFVRQDGALIGSIDLAIDKAATARIFDKATFDLARMAQPGAPLYGIQETNVGKVVIFGGGIPVTLNGSIVGAVGASAGTVEQDVAVAEAAIAALGPEISEVR